MQVKNILLLADSPAIPILQSFNTTHKSKAAQTSTDVLMPTVATEE